MQGGKKVLVKLGQFDRAFVILRELVKEKLPFKASYWLRRDLDVISKVYQPFIDSKMVLFKEFAELDESGNPKVDESGMNVRLIDEKKEEFWKQYMELAGKEVEVEIYPLSIGWFDKVEGTVEELAAIDFLLEAEGNA